MYDHTLDAHDPTLDRDSEFALSSTLIFDPAYGDGSMLADPKLDTAYGESVLLGVTAYS